VNRQKNKRITELELKIAEAQLEAEDELTLMRKEEKKAYELAEQMINRTL